MIFRAFVSFGVHLQTIARAQFGFRKINTNKKTKTKQNKKRPLQIYQLRQVAIVISYAGKRRMFVAQHLSRNVPPYYQQHFLSFAVLTLPFIHSIHYIQWGLRRSVKITVSVGTHSRLNLTMNWNSKGNKAGGTNRRKTNVTIVFCLDQ